MTSLTDLPPEIHERLSLGNTPVSNSTQESEELWLKERRTIAALARTCRKLHGVYNPVLYRSLALTTLPVTNRLKLIRTLASRPELADYVEDVHLHLYNHRFALRDSTDSTTQEAATRHIEASDGDWYRLLGHLFFPYTRNLKQLYICCTRYERIPGDFGELVFAHIRSHCQSRGIGIDHDGVEQLMLAPKMQTLVLSGPYITKARQLDDLIPGSSNISMLSLRIVLISRETIGSLLQLPNRLTSFDFYSASMRCPTQEDRGGDPYLTFRDIGRALESQKHNLDTIKICLPSSDAELAYTVFGDLTFDSFSRLTNLSIAPEMFLGWKQCLHLNPNADRMFGPPDPITFADCLPHCLEELTIFAPQYQRVRNGNGYAYDVVRGVLQQRKRLYKLSSITLACCKGVLFCSQCRLTALTYLDRSPSVKKTEVAEIQALCERSGMEFTWIDEVWEDP